jgi:AbrB family looped-hinge helix DNA binding protein
MPIVTVKNKFQVVIPRAVRVELGISRGDLLEARVERGKLTYTRKTVIEPPPPNKADQARYFKQLRKNAPEWLKEFWATSKRAGLDKMTLREVDAEIAAARRGRSAEKPKRSSK